MSDIMAETMVTGFKRLPQRAYLGGHTSRFGSRTHFQLATFLYALTETPELALAILVASSVLSHPMRSLFLESLVC